MQHIQHIVSSLSLQAFHPDSTLKTSLAGSHFARELPSAKTGHTYLQVHGRMIRAVRVRGHARELAAIAQLRLGDAQLRRARRVRQLVAQIVRGAADRLLAVGAPGDLQRLVAGGLAAQQRALAAAHVHVAAAHQHGGADCGRTTPADFVLPECTTIGFYIARPIQFKIRAQINSNYWPNCRAQINAKKALNTFGIN